MATEPEPATQTDGDHEPFGAGTGRRYEDLRGRLFEYTLVGATLIGIVSLVILMLYVLWDALELPTADTGWYLVYLATVVAPTTAFWLWLRRDQPARTVSFRLWAALLGGLAVGLVVYTVPLALDPTDVLVFFLTTAVPTAAVFGYGRSNPDATWTGPGVPVAAVGGLLVGFAVFDPVRAALQILAPWVAYALYVAVPVALGAWFVVDRRRSRRATWIAGVAALGVTLLAVGASLARGLDPSPAAVLVPTVVVPVGLVVADAASTRREGLAGLASPVVVIGGLLVGAALTTRLGLAAPDTWLTYELLTESFSTLNPRDAGIYPQLVGSIVLVGLMAVIIFPVGVAAAVFLEEYAPQTGLGGRVTQLIQVNIANLAGVPSVVYGLLGLGIFANLLGFERGLLIAGSVTLGLLILPIVIVASQEALRSVPQSLRQASYGMGASRWQTVRNVVLPEAVPGILTGTILALGRAIGETAPILLIGVATTKLSPPGGIFEKATALPLQIFASRSLPQPEYRYGVVAAAVVVLLVLMLSMNAIAIVLRNKYQRQT
ncbi:MAG: phosphate ABC transporter permease PstA [Haloferacaceae archaeon]